MKTAPLLALAPLVLAAGPAAPDPVTALAGRYSHHFINGDISGASFGSDDVVEIVPVDARHAYIRFELNFFNGHSCSLSGIAGAEGNELVYRDLGNQNEDGSRCVLHVKRDRDQLAWNDQEGTCKSYCGTRGSFEGDSIAWLSKRPITYIAKLRHSFEYRTAITEWRTGKPAP